MGPPLSLDGQISSSTLSLSWTRPSDYQSFNIRIGKTCCLAILNRIFADKCDAKVDCYTIHDKNYSANNMSITDEIFSQCTIYNVHIEAMSGQKQTLRDEINITNQTPECFLTEELVLVVGFTLLGILIMCAVGMACYYKKKSPLYNISR